MPSHKYFRAAEADCIGRKNQPGRGSLTTVLAEGGGEMAGRRGGFNYADFLTGFIVGGLVGAAAAILLAPQSGEETRALIRDKSIELKDQSGKMAQEARKQAPMSGGHGGDGGP